MLSDIVACGKCRTEPSLMAGEAAFCLCPATILPPGEAVVHHLSIPSFRRAWGVARIDGDHGAADAKLDAAQNMVMFRVIGFVRQNPSRPQIGRRLSHGRDKIRGILAGAKTGNGTHNQLRSRVKHSGQLGPRRVRRIARDAFALKVNRDMPRFQTGGVDRRRIAGIIRDQAAGPATVATSREKPLESPFSRSFCSTCHNVE